MSNTVNITPFYHGPTNSWSYIVADSTSRLCALIDPVMDFEMASGKVHPGFANQLLEVVESHGLSVEWVLDTHIHADHLSAADYVRGRTGARVGIGVGVHAVSQLFEQVFNLGDRHPDVSEAFDGLFEAGQTIPLGSSLITVMAVPGHTPACVAYRVSEAVFIGDTLFRPDYGTARTDFPGGNAGELYASIQQLLALPDDTLLYLCHDYPSHPQSAPQASCSVREARDNVQLQAGDMNGFVRFRERRDTELDTPKLLYPAIQINLAAGRLPEPELEQQRFLKLPIFVDP